MSRYSSHKGVFDIGAFIEPLLPLSLAFGLYKDSLRYEVVWSTIPLLWFLGLAINYALIVVHELGHVFVARLLGWTVESVTIGQWHRLFSFSVGPATVTVRSAPSPGFVQTTPAAHENSVYKAGAFLLAGSLAEVGAGVSMFLLDRPPLIETPGELLLSYSRINVFCAVTYHVILNLWPRADTADDGHILSDGLLLRHVWRQSRLEPAYKDLSAKLEEAGRLCQDREFPEALRIINELALRHPENVLLQKQAAHLYSECGDTVAAEKIWRDLLGRPLGTPEVFAEILDSLSRLPLYHRRTDLLAAADGWTSEALRHSPHAITLKGTRGAILVELGRFDEGIEMLR